MTKRRLCLGKVQCYTFLTSQTPNLQEWRKKQFDHYSLYIQANIYLKYLNTVLVYFSLSQIPTQLLKTAPLHLPSYLRHVQHFYLLIYYFPFFL